MSVIDDVLSAASIETTIFGRLELPPDWAIGFDPAGKAAFHVVARGHAWLEEPSLAAPRRVEAGEVVLLARGTGHAIKSHPREPARPYTDVIPRLRPGGGGTVLMCGAYKMKDVVRHPLFTLLPAVVHMSARDREPLGTLLSLLEAERAEPGFGTQAAVSKLVDVMFIHIIRAWIEGEPAAVSSWLEASRDPRIAGVLRAIHARPAEEWTLDALAEIAKMSRASFVRRFRALTGEAPLTYVARWRMSQAEKMLRDTTLSIAEIATRVGYRSEFAFSKAFRRTRGVAPLPFRRGAAA